MAWSTEYACYLMGWDTMSGPFDLWISVSRTISLFWAHRLINNDARRGYPVKKPLGAALFRGNAHKITIQEIRIILKPSPPPGQFP
jgi:hypothetical protein